MVKKTFSIILLLFFLNTKVVAIEEVFIKYKINNEIITNIDIKNEAKYLTALNNKLEKLNNKKLIAIAEDSIIKETIKKIELLKYFKLDQNNPFLDKVIKDFYLKLGLNKEEEFEKYLNNYNLTIKDVKKKIEIETSWNQIVYDRYNNQIKIDKVELKKIVKIKKNTQNKIFYELSEIIFEKEKDQTLNEKINKINESIKEIGFENTANLYSISDNAKFGGKIGWIEKENLSKKISKIIDKMEIGSHTRPIKIGNGFMILRLENKKSEIKKIDEKQELKKMIQLETNKQLAQFSKIYFNKIKINTVISEL